MSYNYLPLDKTPTNFQQVKNLLAFDQLVSITFDAHFRITECRSYLDAKLESKDAIYYGINTGFGYLQNVKIDAAQLEELQSNLLKSHACGLGEELGKSRVAVGAGEHDRVQCREQVSPHAAIPVRHERQNASVGELLRVDLHERVAGEARVVERSKRGR